MSRAVAQQLVQPLDEDGLLTAFLRVKDVAQLRAALGLGASLGHYDAAFVNAASVVFWLLGKGADGVPPPNLGLAGSWVARFKQSIRSVSLVLQASQFVR